MKLTQKLMMILGLLITSSFAYAATTDVKDTLKEGASSVRPFWRITPTGTIPATDAENAKIAEKLAGRRGGGNTINMGIWRVGGKASGPLMGMYGGDIAIFSGDVVNIDTFGVMSEPQAPTFMAVMPEEPASETSTEEARKVYNKKLDAYNKAHQIYEKQLEAYPKVLEAYRSRYNNISGGLLAGEATGRLVIFSGVTLNVNHYDTTDVAAYDPATGVLEPGPVLGLFSGRCVGDVYTDKLLSDFAQGRAWAANPKVRLIGDPRGLNPDPAVIAARAAVAMAPDPVDVDMEVGTASASSGSGGASGAAFGTGAPVAEPVAMTAASIPAALAATPPVAPAATSASAAVLAEPAAAPSPAPAASTVVSPVVPLAAPAAVTAAAVPEPDAATAPVVTAAPAAAGSALAPARLTPWQRFWRFLGFGRGAR